MYRRGSRILLGSFILNQRLVVDWWQPFYRADVHTRAKQRLSELESSGWYQQYVLQGDPSSGGAVIDTDEATASGRRLKEDTESDPHLSESSFGLEGGDVDHDANLMKEELLVEEAALQEHERAAAIDADGVGGLVGDEEEFEREAAEPHELPSEVTPTHLKEEEVRKSLKNGDAASPSNSSSSTATASTSISLPREHRPPAPMHLYEANALVTTFTNQHNTEGLSTILRYIREGLEQPLTHFHYHALLRLFAYRQEQEEAVEVLEVMSSLAVPLSEEESKEDPNRSLPAFASPLSSSFSLETYARVMDVLHCIAPEDVLERLLQAVSLAQDRFRVLRRTYNIVATNPNAEMPSSETTPSSSHSLVTPVGVLWSRDAAGSEGATVAGFSVVSPEGQLAMADPEVMPGPLPEHILDEEDDEGGGGIRQNELGTHAPHSTTGASSDLSSPPLTSLLHHVSHSTRFSPLAALLVAMWIRGLGLQLSDWDHGLLLTAVMTKRSTFPFVAWCIGSLDGGGAAGTASGNGWVTPLHVLHRLRERRRALEHKLYGSTGTAAASTRKRNSRRAAKSTSVNPGGLEELEALEPLLEHLSASFRKAGVPLDTPVDVRPWMNTGTLSWGHYVENILAEVSATRSASSCFRSPAEEAEETSTREKSLLSRFGLGPHRYNPALLTHFATLLFSVSRDDTSAVELLLRAVEGVRPSTASTGRTEKAEEKTPKVTSPTKTTTAADRASATPLRLTLEEEVNETLWSDGKRAKDVHHTACFQHSCPNANGEPYHISVHHLLDIGSLLSKVSHRTAQHIRQPYVELAKRLSSEAASARQETELLMVSARSDRSLRKNAAPPSSSSASFSSYAEKNHREAFTDAIATSPPAVLCAGLSLATPLTVPSLADSVSCESYSIPMLDTTAEARAALQHTVSMTNASIGHQPRHVRQLYMQVAEFCARHPRRNPKLTSAGLVARRKWWSYLEARDTALALFGSTPRAREVMKNIFYNDYTLPIMRSPGQVAKDFEDVRTMFQGFNRKRTQRTPSPTRVSGSDPNTTSFSRFTTGTKTESEDPADSLSASAPSSSSSTALSQLTISASSGLSAQELVFQRRTAPHLRLSSDPVPRYLFDPKVYNPYPHLHLKIPILSSDGSPGVDDESSLGEEEEVDLFAELWSILMNPSKVGPEQWYLTNTDIFLSLLRCLLHRLDWEAAVDFTLRHQEKNAFTYKMDQELNQIFFEIGDPAGALAFKVATKLFDGRILYEGQVKRTQFHEGRDAVMDGEGLAGSRRRAENKK